MLLNIWNTKLSATCLLSVQTVEKCKWSLILWNEMGECKAYYNSLGWHYMITIRPTRTKYDIKIETGLHEVFDTFCVNDGTNLTYIENWSQFM